MRRLLFLLVGLAVCGLAACDPPTAPERVNPYDPAAAGERIPTPPDSLRIASATATSVTLAWRDASSFETGVRVQRSVVDEGPDAPGAGFLSIALLPAGATTYTDATLTDSEVRVYRLVAIAGQVVSAPSSSIAVGPPLERRVFPRDVVDPTRVIPLVLSADEATFYARVLGETGIAAFDAQTGVRRGRVADALSVAGTLADGRVALRLGETGGGPPRVALVRGGVVEQTVVLDSRCFTTRLVVSADGGTAAGTCANGEPVTVWRLPSGDYERTVGENGYQALSLSPDGAQVYIYSQDANRLTAWSTTTGTPRWTRGGLSVLHLVAGPVGEHLLASTESGVALLRAASGATVATDTRDDAVDRFPGAFSPDGRLVAYRAERGERPETRLARVDGLAPVFLLLDPPVGTLLRATNRGVLTIGKTSVGTSTVLALADLDVTQPWREVPVPGRPSTAFAHGLR